MSHVGLELQLLRHAESAAPAGHAIGQWDLPLSRRGATSLTDFVRSWHGRPPDRIVCSDLERTQCTANAIAERFGLPLSLDSDWREVSLGEWEQRAWTDLEQQDGERLAAWYADWRHVAPPGGENWASVTARVRRAVARLVDTNAAGARVLVVTHVGAIRAFLGQVAGVGDERAFAMSLPPLGGVLARRVEATGTAASWQCEMLPGPDAVVRSDPGQEAVGRGDDPRAMHCDPGLTGPRSRR
jgi:alpha-ribazole phosphatase